ncbi:hypothetical protein, partial [Parvibaculum sp.]|uniref:hypothetical protein n=1 Tax=Parvibaculum sp. TaxID=2024848 RepID=UPI003299F460
GKNLALNFRDTVRLAGLSVSAALLIAGCTVVEGGNASKGTSGKDKAELSAAQAVTLANQAIASAHPLTVASSGIPIPLPAPRRASPVQVASIDPSAGVSALSSRPALQDFAGVYGDFGSAIAAADANKLRTPGDVRRALAALTFDKPNALAEGWYVKQAMIAAGDPVFAQGVRTEVRARNKTAVLEALSTDENFVMQLPGVSSASAAVAVSIRNEHQRIKGLADRFIDTAYKFQKQKWGMSTPVPGMAETKTAALDEEPSLADKARAVAAALSPVSTAQAYSPSVMNRILTLGAYQVIEGSMEKGLAESKTSTGRCLNWARLNLAQCIAAAHFPSEEAYCTGKHAIAEVGSCWAEALPPSTLAN